MSPSDRPRTPDGGGARRKAKRHDKSKAPRPEGERSEHQPRLASAPLVTFFLLTSSPDASGPLDDDKDSAVVRTCNFHTTENEEHFPAHYDHK